VSGLAYPVEAVESRKPDVGAIGSRVGESLLECFIMTQEKRSCKLAELAPISRFRRSFERCKEAVKNVFY